MDRHRALDGEPVFFVDSRRRPNFSRRLRPRLVVETSLRIRSDGGWFALVAQSNRTELWAGKLRPGEACLTVLDPSDRAVAWFTEGVEDVGDAGVAERCLPGAGGLWSEIDDDEVQEAWHLVRYRHAIVVLADAADFDPDILEHLAETHHVEVAQAVDTWLGGAELGAAGMIRAVALRESLGLEGEGPEA